jgi:hypothetical protein
MRIVPAADHATSYTHLKTAGAPSAPGLHDTLRYGLGPTPAHLTQGDAPSSRHPLESRLKAWEATQQSVRMESLRKTFGMAEPIRRGMELKIAAEGEWRPLALGGGMPSVHEDILRGRDAAISWEDIYTNEEQRPVVGVHEEIEKKLKV